MALDVRPAPIVAARGVSSKTTGAAREQFFKLLGAALERVVFVRDLD